MVSSKDEILEFAYDQQLRMWLTALNKYYVCFHKTWIWPQNQRPAMFGHHTNMNMDTSWSGRFRMHTNYLLKHTSAFSIQECRPWWCVYVHSTTCTVITHSVAVLGMPAHLQKDPQSQPPPMPPHRTALRSINWNYVLMLKSVRTKLLMMECQ